MSKKLNWSVTILIFLSMQLFLWSIVCGNFYSENLIILLFIEGCLLATGYIFVVNFKDHVIVGNVSCMDRVIAFTLAILLICSFNISFFSIGYFNAVWFKSIVLVGLFALFYVCNIYFIKYLAIEMVIKVVDNHIKSRFILRTIVLFLIGIVYVLVFFPGLMSPDSIEQWGQIHTASYNNYQPIFHTFINSLLLKIYDSPLSISTFQLSCFSLIVSYGLYVLEKLGIKTSYTRIVFVWFIVNPAYMIMSITLWKDIPYSLVLLLLTIILFKLVIQHRSLKIRKKDLIACSILLSLVVLLRHNGIVVYVFTLISLLLVFKKTFRNWLFVSIISLLIIIFSNGILYSFYDIEDVSNGWSYYVMPLHQIGGLIDRDVKIDQHDLVLVEEIMDINAWKRNFNPNVPYYIVANEDFDLNFFYDNKSEILSIWFKMATSNLIDTIDIYMHETSVLWRIHEYSNGYTYTSTRYISSNEFGLSTKSYFPSYLENFDKVLKLTDSKYLNWIFWRPGIYLYLIVLSNYVIVRKTKIYGLLVGMPTLTNLIGLMATVQAQDTRYMYVALLVMPFLVGMSKLDYIRSEERNT